MRASKSGHVRLRRSVFGVRRGSLHRLCQPTARSRARPYSTRTREQSLPGVSGEGSPLPPVVGLRLGVHGRSSGRALGGRFEILRRGRQLRHGRRRVGCRLEQRVLDGRDEPGRVGCTRLGRAERRRRWESRRACALPALPPTRSAPREPTTAAITPAITGASSSAIAAAVATPTRKSTSRSRRGTVGPTSNRRPDRAHPGVGGAAPESPASSLQPGSEAGRPGPPSRRTSA